MKRLNELLEDCRTRIKEIYPWDLEEEIKQDKDMLLLDVREPDEFSAAALKDSINVPRGVLETAIEWGYEDTIPELVRARDRYVVVVCRSGLRSLLAADVMAVMGYENVVNLATGLRGWNDYEQPLIDKDGSAVDIDDADELFASDVTDEQLGP